MMRSVTKKTLYLGMLLLLHQLGHAQPWKSPLNIAWSADGITFSAPSVFQDSSGVPSVIRWKGDTLIAAFQWFRQPNPSATWDRVATKFSFDNGITWTPPTPIIVNNLPSNYQRPFDPTLVHINGDSLRIYFSSSDGLTAGGLDSTINTYSAVSADGIHFTFEPLARVDVINNRVIDPAVILFNNAWHYLSPKGAPQDGAYHFVSPDGITFSQVPDITSDNFHNWTGNYCMVDSSELRFYGSGATIWYNATANGGVWNGYITTNMTGGDPTVLKTDSNNYLMVYVGPPYPVGEEELISNSIYSIFPNPASSYFNLSTNLKGEQSWSLSDITGREVLTFHTKDIFTQIPISTLSPGIYLLINVKQADIKKRLVVQ